MKKSRRHSRRQRALPGIFPALIGLGTFGIVSISGVALFPTTALAANECGVGADVTCGPAGNPYASGILYENDVDQTVRVAAGVVTNAVTSYGISLTGAGSQTVVFEGAVELNVNGGFAANSGGVSSRDATRFDIDTRLGTINVNQDTSGINVFYQGSATDNRILTGNINTLGFNTSAMIVGAFHPDSVILIDTRGGKITSNGAGVYVTSEGTANIFTGDITVNADSYQSALYVQGSKVLNIDTTAGTIETTGIFSDAVTIYNSGTTKLTTGDIRTEGQDSVAVSVTSYGRNFFPGDALPSPGSVSIDTRAGAITTEGDQSTGIKFTGGVGYVYDNNSVVTDYIDAADLTLRSGAISTTGNLSSAVVVMGGGVVDIDTTAGKIITEGDGSGGVVVFGDRNVAENVTGSLSVTTGNIETSGNAAFGVAHYVYAGPLNNESIYSPPAFPGTPTVMNLNGEIIASGDNSGGVVSLQADVTAPITINANANITASGQNSVGIAAGSYDGSVEINIAQNTVIEGGWSATPGDLSPGYSDTEINQTGIQGIFDSYGGVGGGLPAAGVVLWSGADGISAVLNNKGTIGALSDLAITQGVSCGTSRHVSPPARLASPSGGAARAIPSSNGCTTSGVIQGWQADIPVYEVAYPSTTGSVHIVNDGEINGFVTLWGGAPHTLDNAGSFNIRNFSDTDGDGVRDTKRVSVSDFGGPQATFNNLDSGVVQLAAVKNAPVTDTTGSYVPTTGTDSRPLDPSFYTITREGVAQGQFVNLQTFNNAGTIDLRGEEVGNTLIITGSDTVGGAAGEGVFVSQGGRFLTNAVLNDGIAPGGASNSFADVLIVDGTALGSAATSIFVGNKGGTGDLTPGNGIMLVEVRDKSRSEDGVFALGDHGYTVDGRSAVTLGKWSYLLYHNGVNAGGVDDTADGNWYLRSQLTPVDPSDPVENPTTPVYEKIPSHLEHLIAPSTMQQRVGNRYWNNPAAPAETVFCKDPSKNFKCEITSNQAQYYLDSKNNIFIEQNGLWGRVEGGYGRFKPSVSHTAQDSRDNWWKLQSGIDGLLYESDAGKFIGGINVSYGQVRSRVDSWLGRPTNGGSTGELSTTGWGVGASLTWLGENGWYVDGQASATWFDMDLDSNALGMTLVDGNNGMGYMASIEAGKRIALNEAWTLIPQAQFYWSHVDFDSFTDPLGLNVSMDRGDSFVGRYGLALEQQETWKDKDDKTRRSSIYGIVNLYNEFLGETRVNWAGETLEQRDARFWGGVGLGGTYNWNDDRYSIYGELAAETSLEDIGDSYKLGGTLGLRVKW
ncbi:autotransporter outer membrane beta-barrel domain-containing protein [Ochrobactrum sp. BTU1]|uniref:autotransporter outer membrane beta-barrel domain-containing protein n=1 Tax=Ochrobactrum sp. BTU1 TaxID=2840456 RepID=UPI001C055B44|nr:autotransporter outer membrane beta-barrel domain-containing protein [Ochrobactrum sp. BTU1]